MTAVNHRHSAIALVFDVDRIGRFIDRDLLGRVPHHRGRLRLRATEVLLRLQVAPLITDNVPSSRLET